ncbi:MAG: hypothetical protein JWM47_3321, partial [Acidimicrobiales bacterium]|nr:hypothetical protein [Acidimicrobiales bacterium]
MPGQGFGRRKGGGLLGMAERAGIARGLFGGSKGWLYVGTGLWTLRTLRRLGERKPEILLSEELRPGQRLVIANGRATIDSVDHVDKPVKAPKGRK